MMFLGILAVCSCLSCIVVKIAMAQNHLRLQRFIELEREKYQKARRHLTRQANQHKIMKQHLKQAREKSKITRRNIANLTKSREQLLKAIEKEEAVKAFQDELLGQLN